jgi:ligand-binding sensor domain-containing protein
LCQRPSAAGRLRIRRLTQRDGLPQNIADKMMLDDAGPVWASTDDGLARIDPSTLAVRSAALGEAGL